MINIIKLGIIGLSNYLSNNLSNESDDEKLTIG